MSKARITELTKQLRDAVTLHDPIAKFAIELVKLICDASKESLVSADGNDMLRSQGAVRILEKLHHDLTTKPAHIAAPETKS